MNMNTEQSRALADLWVEVQRAAMTAVGTERAERARARFSGVNAALRIAVPLSPEQSVLLWVERHRTPRVGVE